MRIFGTSYAFHTRPAQRSLPGSTSPVHPSHLRCRCLAINKLTSASFSRRYLQHIPKAYSTHATRGVLTSFKLSDLNQARSNRDRTRLPERCRIDLHLARIINLLQCELVSSNGQTWDNQLNKCRECSVRFNSVGKVSKNGRHNTHWSKAE